MILLVFITIAGACTWGFHRLAAAGRLKVVKIGLGVEAGLCVGWMLIWMLTSDAVSLGAAYAMLLQAGYLCASVIGYVLANRPVTELVRT